MRKGLDYLFFLLGLVLAIATALSIRAIPLYLKATIKRQWLYSVDVAPVDKRLLIFFSLLLIITALILSYVLREFLSKTSFKARIGIFVLISLLFPLKNSAFSTTAFFSLGMLSAVLMWKATLKKAFFAKALIQRLVDFSLKLSSKAWARLVFFLSFVVNLLSALLLLNGMPHIIDEIVYLFQAKTFARLAISAPLPEPYDFFHFISVAHHNGKWFSQYPPGWPVLLCFGVLIKAPWLINPLLGALSVLVIYFLARTLFEEKTARLSSFLASFSPYLFTHNGSMMAHTSCGFSMTAFFLFSWYSLKGRNILFALLAGFFLGLSGTIRPYSAFALFIPTFFLFLIEMRNEPVKLVKIGFLILSGAIIPVCLMFYYNHLLTGSWLRFGYQVLHDHTNDLGFGPRQFPFPHTPFEGIRVAISRVSALSQNLWLVPFPVFFIAILPIYWKDKLKENLWLACSFLALVIAYIFFFGHDFFYYPRYIFEASLVFVILVARGILLSFQKIQDKEKLAHFILVSFALSIFLFTPSYLSQFPRIGEIGPELRNAIKEHRIQGSVILIEELYFPMGMALQSPFLDSDNIYARDLRDRNKELFELYPDKKFFRFYFDPNTRKFVIQKIDGSKYFKQD